MHRIIPVINAIVLSVFTIATTRTSFSLFIMLCTVLGAIGLIFMRRKTPDDQFYVRSSLITAALCTMVYIAVGVGQNKLPSFILFAFVATPAYLSMGYALAAMVYRSKTSSTDA